MSSDTELRDGKSQGLRALIATDGSIHSLRAARFLVERMRPHGLPEVHVINVQPPLPFVDLLPCEKQANIERRIQQIGNAASADVCEVLADARVPYQLHVVSGDAAESIVRCAREAHCDVIMMGTRGMGAVAGLALGSVATKVIHLADVPVTLVK